MANLTDADKVLRNDTGKSIVSKLDGIKDAIVAQGGGAHSLDQLSDVEIDSQTLAAGQSIVYNETTQKFENGQVSTVGGLNDLNDVTITSVSDKQELVYNGTEEVFENKTTRVELTQAEYDALANPLPDVDYYITDAPSMQGTSADLSYDGDTDSVYDVVEGVKSDVTDLSTPQTITPTFNTQQSDYSIPYNNTSVVKVGKVVMCMVNPRCLNSIGSYPGTLVYSGFPKPIDGLNHYFTVANWQRSGDATIRFMLTANGELYLRNGTVDSEYDGSFMYLSE